MKRIFFTIIIATLTLTSCVVESYEKPKRTIVGYNISEHVSADIRTVSSIADITRIVDLWSNAATAQEKFDIEDKYFGDDIKLRQYRDGITIVGYYDFKTSGKPLLESKWRVTSLNNQLTSNSSYEISLTGVDEYHINILHSSNESPGALTVKVISPDKEYAILGNSTIAPLFTTAHYDKITYSITAPVAFFIKGEEPLLWRWQPHLKQQEGSVNIEMHKSGVELEQDKTSAKYAPQGVEISYRGFKDFYTYSDY